MLSDFYEKVALVIIQYLLIACIVSYLTHRLSRSLEQHKSNISLQQDFAKHRVAKIAECWSALYAFEANTRYMHVEMTAFIREHGTKSDEDYVNRIKNLLDPLEEKSQLEAINAQSKVEMERFWIGEKLYFCFIIYQNLLVDYLEAVIENDQDNLIKVWNHIGQSKKELSTVLKEYQRGWVE